MNFDIYPEMKNFTDDLEVASTLAREEGATRGLRLIEKALNLDGREATLHMANTDEAYIALDGGRMLILDDEGSFWGSDVDLPFDEAFDNAEDAAKWINRRVKGTVRRVSTISW